MRFTESSLPLALAVLMLAGSGVVVFADDSHGKDKAIREVQGVVTSVVRESTPDGGPWLIVTIREDEGESIPMRVAPVDVLEDAGFELGVGDRARAQVFVEETPHPVARFRNIDHGTTLRLRCLHGEPIWIHPGFGSGQQGAGAGAARVRRRGG